MAYDVLVKAGIFSERHFSINENSLTFHETEMECREIEGFAYEIFTLKANSFYRIYLIDTSGDELKIEFTLAQFMDDNPESVYARMVQECWKYFGQRILNETIHDLSIGQEWEIGNVLLNKSGINYQYKPWFSPEITVTVAWDDVTFQLQENTIEIKSATDSKVSHTMFFSTYNVHVLAAILASIQRDPEMLHYLTARKKFPN